MSRERLIALGIAAFLAIAGALLLSTQRNLPRDPHGSSFLPSLAAELNTVTSVSVRKGSPIPTVTVHKQGEQWTVAERADYPADVLKLRKLLQSLNDAKIREEKTSNPANYSIIGVEDPLKPLASGAQIELIARDGKHDVIIGKSVGNGNFVRRAGETTSYVIEPAIFLETEPRFWIDTKLLDIPADKIQSIETKPATGPGYSLRRALVGSDKAAAASAPTTAPAATAPGATAPGPAAPADKFVLDAVPAGRQAADPQTLANSATLLSNLAIDDVSPASEVDFSKPSRTTVTLSDGSVVALSGMVVGDKHWIQVSASKDASLGAKTGGRAFEIASYRYDGLFRPLEQLLMPKAAAGAARPKP
ncbi:MAG: DUF4340 domain-containing protein [Pseudomonadota bacterium]|nr:DUF4340 domain-containing protein [Pseudomonadota bacterium]